MTRKLILFLLIALGWCRLTGQTGAPQGFNYQSVVRDANDNPLANQTVTLLMTVRSGAPNGPVAYSEKHVTSTNDYGLVNLVVGQGGTPLQGSFTSVNWAGGPKYLTVSIETSPNVYDELGSSQLMSVPYALYAQTAGSGTGTGSGDNWGSQVVQTGPSLQGNGTAASPIALAQNGAQNGQVLKWNGTAWVPSDDAVGSGGGGGTLTQINTGAGLTGGPITTSGTISLAPTGVTPGAYGSASQIPVISVDAQGRVTSAFTVIASPGDQTAINAGSGINVAQNGPTFTITNTGDTNPNDDLAATTPADGDVSGVFSNLQIKTGVVGSPELATNAVTTAKIADDAVTTAKIADEAVTNDKIADNAVGAAELQSNAVTTTKIAGNAVTTAKVADAAITAAKLDDMGAANGQVLKWNGSAWAPAADQTGGSSLNLSPGAGINIIGTAPNLTILNTGDLNPDDDLTATATFNGDVTGPFNNLQLKAGVVGTTELATGAATTVKIADDAVTTAKLADDAVTGVKIASMNATNGQVLKWNGTVWAPAVDQAGTVTLTNGPGISVSGGNGNYTIGNTGDANDDDDVLKTTQHDGDVSGVYNNLQIKPGVVGTPEIAPAAVTAVKLAQMGATSGQVLKWNGTAWAPAADQTGGPGAGDNWGTQVVETTATLSGNGTAASPLTIATQSATAGQVLKFNGTTWVPGNDNTGGPGGGTVSIVGGTGISVTGGPSDYVVTNTGDADGSDDLTTATQFNGDVSGPASDLQIKTGVVGSTEITDGDVKTADLANESVTGAKIADMGATVGQVLKFNGLTWAPANDNTGGGGGSVGILAGAGINVTSNGSDYTVINTGDTDATNDLTIATIFNGDVTGSYANLQLQPDVVTATEIAANAVNTSEIANSAVTAAKLDDMNAAAGQVLKWNGTAWAPAADQTGALNLTAGTGIAITGTAPNLTIANTGDTDKDPDNELQTLSLNGTELSLSVNNSTVDFAPLLTSAGLNLWQVNGDHLHNTNSGNVGINLNNPVFRLDVNGDGHFRSPGPNPQLVLENASNDYTRLLMKNNGGSGAGWLLEGRDAGGGSEFHMELKGSINARFVTLRADRNVIIGENSTNGGMGLVLNHADNGLVMTNVANTNDRWEFWVSDNTLANTLQLEHNGNAVGAFTTAGLYVPSDRRLKKDIHDLPPVLERLRNLDAYAYRYIRQEDDARESIGFMAQDLQTQFPELVNPMPARRNEPSYLSVNYGGLSVVAIKAIQEQQQQIEALQQTNQQLQQRLEALEARLSRLEKQ